MKKVQTRMGDLLIRVRDFGEKHNDDFPATSVAGQLVAQVANLVKEFEQHSAAQAASAAAARASTAAKESARLRLMKMLRALSRTVRAIGVEDQSIREKFRVPRSGDQPLLAAARGCMEPLGPLVPELAKREMPDVLVNLRKEINAFQATVTEHNRNASARVKATAAIDDAVVRGRKLIGELDSIVNNKYAGDEPALAAWRSASHLQRAARGPKGKSSSDQGDTGPSTKGASPGP